MLVQECTTVTITFIPLLHDEDLLFQESELLEAYW